MSDKAKRKNSPNRRRKFLMIFIAVDVVVVIGLFALIPQFNAWLDSDPFTPQCHFEEDRLFAVDKPPVIRSMTSPISVPDEVGDSPYYAMNWSPDGQYLAAMKLMEYNLSQIDILDTNGGIAHSAKGHLLPDDRKGWSPDGRYLTFVAWSDTFEIESIFVLDMRSFEIVYETPSPYVDILGWSPDGANLLLQRDMLLDQDVASLSVSVVRIEDDQDRRGFSIDYSTDKGIHFRFIGWSDDSQQLYFLVDGVLTEYDVRSGRLREIRELPISSKITYATVHGQQVIIVSETGTMIALDTDRGETEIHEKIVTKFSPIGWIPNTSKLLFYNLYEGGTGQLALLDAETFMILPIDDLGQIKSLDASISHDGRYVLYLRGKAYQLYDLEKNTRLFNVALESYPAPHWLNIDGHSYIRLGKYLWNPDTSQNCKFNIPFSIREIQIQPQG